MAEIIVSAKRVTAAGLRMTIACYSTTEPANSRSGGWPQQAGTIIQDATFIGLWPEQSVAAATVTRFFR